MKLEPMEPRSHYGQGGLMAVLLICFVAYLLWLTRRAVLGSVLRLVAVGRKRDGFSTGHQA